MARTRAKPILQSLDSFSRITVRIRRAVATLEPHLMRAVRGRPLDEELLVKHEATVGLGVELHHPALDAIGIELRIDGAIKRIGEVDGLAVPADLHHLRSAAQIPVPGTRMRGPGH